MRTKDFTNQNREFKTMRTVMKTKFFMFSACLLVCLILTMFSLSNLPAQIHERTPYQFPAFSVQTEMNTGVQLSTPTFSNRIRLKTGGVNMKVDTYTSVPCVVDWNEDGKKDLLVGCFYYGNVYLFLNSGTDTVPVFTTGTKLKADGQEISVAYG
jgi:hypothetical protein